MFLEILITLVIVLSSVYMLYKKIKNKAAGKCDCGSCSSHCPMYKETHKSKE